jgi:sigma-E factor negative regulatory protein RseA
MKEQQRQAVSALLDGESSAPQIDGLLDALERDGELRDVWERYHLIGGALRSEGVALTYRDIAAGVRTRIAAEPTVLAPAPRSLRHAQPARVSRPSRLAPFAGVALAASAAFLAVFAVPTLFQSGVDPLDGTLVAETVPPNAGGASLVSSTTPLTPSAAAARSFSVGRPGQRWHIDQPAVENKLDRYLVSHQEYAPATGMNRMLPYATLVSYDAGR